MLKITESPSIFRLIFVNFCLISLILLGIIAYEDYNTSWKSVLNEATEKHQLLAINLTKSISLYVQDRSTQLGYLAKTLADNDFTTEAKSEHLSSFFKSFSEIASLAYVKHSGELEKFLHDDTRITTNPAASLSIDAFAQQPYFIKTRDHQMPLVEAIVASPFTNKPTIIITKPVPRNGSGADATTDVLIAELNIAPIEELRRSILFGNQGQPSIFDSNGRVIAHANSQWMAEMKDLSSLPVVKEMISGHTGVTEYVSPEAGEMMVAGYTFVPRLNWGVMVDQPKSEISNAVKSELSQQMKWSLGAMICALLFAIPLTRWITRPINSLASSAESLTRNQFKGDIIAIPRTAPKEVIQLGDTIQGLIAGLRSAKTDVDLLNRSLQQKVDEATSELLQTNKQLEKIAETDFLTGLSNRRHFETQLKLAIEDYENNNKTSALLYIDLDNFKLVNDSFGHETGDAMIIKLANLITEQKGPEDLASRLGGDEFAILVGDTSESDALRIANHISDSISKFREIRDMHRIRLSASIGLVMINSSGLTIQEVLRQADACCYLSKVNGGNRVWKYNKNQIEVRKHWNNLELINTLSRAMKSKRLDLVMQPIVAMHSQAGPQRHEVLLRLSDEAGKQIAPETFLPAVVEYGLMPDLDQWVISKLFRWMQKNNIAEPAIFFINISAQTLEDNHFQSFLQAQQAKYNIDPGLIYFEITETSGIKNLLKTSTIMNRLKHKGYLFALDDFGSGLSSFQYLKKLPVTIVKIDGDFVIGAVKNELDRKVVQSIVDVCHSQNILTVAESVETREIYDSVKELEIDYAQGYYVGHEVSLFKPASSADVNQPSVSAG